MEIMGKCPFWNEPCLKEGCSAFQYITHCLWENKEDSRYRHFPKRPTTMFEKHNDYWDAYNIPFCRVLDKELPMRPKHSIEILEAAE